jgi:hypothetical protein
VQIQMIFDLDINISLQMVTQNACVISVLETWGVWWGNISGISSKVSLRSFGSQGFVAAENCPEGGRGKNYGSKSG